jgi:hypothetical protein
MAKISSEYRTLVERLLGKWAVGRPRKRRNDNIRVKAQGSTL